MNPKRKAHQLPYSGANSERRPGKSIPALELGGFAILLHKSLNGETISRIQHVFASEEKLSLLVQELGFMLGENSTTPSTAAELAAKSDASVLMDD